MGNQIYIADLAAYNEGRLIGKWVEAERFAADPEELQLIINEEVLRTCDFCRSHGTTHEEWAIHDYDSFPDLGEYPGIDSLVEVADLVEHRDPAAVAAFIANGYVLEDFDQAYHGVWDSEEEFAEELIEPLRDLIQRKLTEHLEYGQPKDWASPVLDRFDLAGYTRDLFNGDFWSARVPDGVAVFGAI